MLKIIIIKMIIIIIVFGISATDMSEAVEPVVNYYKNVYDSDAAYMAKICGIVAVWLIKLLLYF